MTRKIAIKKVSSKNITTKKDVVVNGEEKKDDENAGKNAGYEVGKGKPPVNTQFKPGQSGNPAGKKKGRRNFNTIFEIALKNYAKRNGKTAEEVEENLMESRIKYALRGDHRFDKDLQERRWGKVPDHMDVTTDGEPIKEIIYIKPKNDVAIDTNADNKAG